MILENKRLLTCAELIAEDSFTGADGKKRAADVGTDHGYLAAYLAANNICESVLACDINKGPLSAAERTIREHVLEDRVTLVLSDGLTKVRRSGISHIICAGMGGELIADIIMRCDWAVCTHLVLQPMSKAESLRRTLYENGWRVIAERAVRDGDFVYSVMLAEHTDKSIEYLCTDRYLQAGRVDPADGGDAADYLLTRARRLRNAAAQMLRSPDENVRAKGRKMTELAERLEKETEGHV